MRPMLSATLALALFIPSIPGEEEKIYNNPELGISFRLPGENWKLTDQSQGVAKVLIFSPKADLSTRCTVLYLPAMLLPEDLITREKQIKDILGEKYRRISYGKDTLGGKEANRLEYATQLTTTIEYGLKDKAFYLVFQLSAPDAAWQNQSIRKELEGIKASFRFTGEARLEPVAVDASTPAEVKARRLEAGRKETPKFELTRHELAVQIDPAAHSLKARDRITIRSGKDGLSRIELYYTVVTVDRVEPASRVTWETHDPGDKGGAGSLEISFRKPLHEGEEILLIVDTSSQDYIQHVEGGLVQEIAVVGQVREDCCFSSHILYYPLDQVNDAAMEISFTVPLGYTAVTGGSLMETRQEKDQAFFRYKTELRKPRALPFGFAVGRYVRLEAKSGSGLPLAVYGYPGEEKRIQQRLDVAVEAADLFEKMMGPLPFEGVRFVHVTPVKKEMGVSLPGLILISDMYFSDIEAVDISDGNLNRRDALSLLIVTDELSHQWNFYAVPLPNELAEGVSTFTNALFVEHRHGHDAYRKAIAFCRNAYQVSVKLNKDAAIADPRIYQTQAYRGIAFCKVPVVLDMLRTELGDEVFFAAWRKAFQHFDEKEDGYEILERSFSEVSGRDLTRFFDQWFFTPGCPEIAVAFSREGKDLAITIRQVQKGAPYYLTGDLLIRGKKGETFRRSVTLSEAETTLNLECGFEVDSVVFDPEALLLLQGP